MTDDVLVRVEGVRKKFCRSLKRSLWYGVQDITAEAIGKGNHEQLRSDEFWAVNDVSFELRRGECLGLIGHNGAGKTTLLKMLNGLIKPDHGRIEMHGRVGALIALGAGFNPILTGRENIYVNGSVLGLTKREIDSKLDEIIDFAEIEDFIDAPVQSYSSGMQVRLGFAIASRMNPDVLLVDEVLAVGDTSFRLKCYNEIFSILKRTAVIFVSHSMSQVTKVCNRGLILEHGAMALLTDSVGKAAEYYLNAVPLAPTRISGNGSADVLEISADHSTGIQNVYLQREKSRDYPVLALEYGSSCSLVFDLKIKTTIQKFHIIITIEDVEAKTVAQAFSANSQLVFENNKSGRHRISAHLDKMLLNRGSYAVSIMINEHVENNRLGTILTSLQHAFRIQVTSDHLQFGVAPVQFAPDWTVCNKI